MTGGRLYRLKDKLQGETFMLTYGDGVSNVNISALLDFHKSHGKIATVTAVKPTPRFGGITFDGEQVIKFVEKPQTGEGWINGGFFVFEPAARRVAGVFRAPCSAHLGRPSYALTRPRRSRH